MAVPQGRSAECSRFRLEWWAVTGSNRRPYRCKRYALPAELTARAAPSYTSFGTIKKPRIVFLSPIGDKAHAVRISEDIDERNRRLQRICPSRTGRRDLPASAACRCRRRRLTRFANDCLEVQLQANCRERDVFIIQPLVTPVQEHLVELLLMLDAARGASASRITVGDAVLCLCPIRQEGCAAHLDRRRGWSPT